MSYLVENALELLIFLPLLPECWDHTHVPPCPIFHGAGDGTLALCVHSTSWATSPNLSSPVSVFCPGSLSRELINQQNQNIPRILDFANNLCSVLFNEILGWLTFVAHLLRCAWVLHTLNTCLCMGMLVRVCNVWRPEIGFWCHPILLATFCLLTEYGACQFG